MVGYLARILQGPAVVHAGLIQPLHWWLHGIGTAGQQQAVEREGLPILQPQLVAVGIQPLHPLLQLPHAQLLQVIVDQIENPLSMLA